MNTSDKKPDILTIKNLVDSIVLNSRYYPNRFTKLNIEQGNAIILYRDYLVEELNINKEDIKTQAFAITAISADVGIA